MSINKKKIITLVLIASFFIIFLYINNVNTYLDSVKESSTGKFLDDKKLQSEIWLTKMNLLFDEKNSKIEENERLKIKSKLDSAYDSAKIIYDKYSGEKGDREIKGEILNALRGSVFITDFTGNTILSRDKNNKQKNISGFESADGRATILEEIQKARKYKEGYIVTTLYKETGKSLIAVKDMDMYSWYMSTLVNLDEKQNLLKSNLLEMLSAMPLENATFMALYENKKPIFVSKNVQEQYSFIEKNFSKEATWHEDKIDGYYYYSNYYAPFDWYLIYGFDTSKLMK